jgi:hypothetical protein
MDRLRANSIDHWCESFLGALRDEPTTPVGRPSSRGSSWSRIAHAAS